MPRLVFVLVLAILSPAFGSDSVSKPVEVDGVVYHVVETTPDKVRILWRDDKEAQLGSLAAADAFLKRKGEHPVFFMNGGIFDVGAIPCGLLVQDGKALRPINLKDGEGNFYLKPNGIFYISEGKACVVDAADYHPDGSVAYAVQSGPLLLKNGETHPVFRKESASRLHRNGVGVTKDGKVILAITEMNGTKFPTLYEFADFFRKQGCANALFLDGTVSRMGTSSDGLKAPDQFASIIAVLGD